jgi:uncharacterized protein YggE
MKAVHLVLLYLLSPSLLFATELPLPDKPHLIIEGRGSVTAVPDIVRIQFEVSATEKDLVTAKQLVDGIVGKAIQAARQQKLGDDQISASKIQAAPQHDWSNQNRIYTGEHVSRQVELTLTEADRYNALVEGLLAAGVSRLDSVELDFSQRHALEEKALALALDDANRQAQSISRHMGITLGKIFQISQLTNQAPLAHMAMRAVAEDSGDKAPLTLGKQPLEQWVRIIYLLKQPEQPKP